MIDSTNDLKLVRGAAEERDSRVTYDKVDSAADRAFTQRIRQRQLDEMNRRGTRMALLNAFGDALVDADLTPDQIKARVRQLFGKEQ